MKSQVDQFVSAALEDDTWTPDVTAFRAFRL